MSQSVIQFSAHGFYDIAVHGQVLWVRATGPWNEQAAQYFCDHTRRAVMAAGFNGQPWAMLAELHGVALYTPGSMPALIALHRWRVSMGLRRIAIRYGSDAVGHSLTRSQFEDVYAAGPDECQSSYFDELDAAQQWLRQGGIDAGPLRLALAAR